MSSRTSTRSSRRAPKPPVQQQQNPLSSSSDSEETYQNEDVSSASENDENDPNGESDTEFTEPEPPRKKKRNNDGAATAENGNFTENHLFRALSSPGIAVSDLALEWIDSFEEGLAENSTAAITDLFNLVLRACGCTQLAQIHDMINEDSAAATVAEIAIVFSSQSSHEYPFVSSNKAVKHFRQNVQEFFRSIVSNGHEKGTLYQQGSGESSSSLGAPMMNSVLAWLSALSACNIRPLRFVATAIILDMQTQLCELAANTTISLQKQQRQLSNARSSLTARNQRVQQSKIAIITESVDTFTLQKNTVLEYIGEIFQHVFVNRYRDVDPQIRIECLRALAQWMVHYEEMFLRADYLRYIGWLLSDPAESVSLEAVRSLLRLYKFINGKREAMSIGFRQFTERFKDQFVNMVWKEKTPGIKVALLEILTELFSLGFLDDTDVLEISSVGFYLAEYESTNPAETKAKIEVCKFIATVSQERTKMDLEPYSEFLQTHESSHFDEDESALSVRLCLKYKALAELIVASHTHYKRVERDLVAASDQRKPLFILVDSLFRIIYSLPGFSGQWEGLIKYTLCDYSSIVFTNKEDRSAAADTETSAELVAKLEISSVAEKQIFMSFIASSIIHILTKEPPKKAHLGHKNDDINTALPILVKYISSLEEYSSARMNLYVIFMSIWNSILITVPTSIARLYSSVSDISDYNKVHDKVLHYYFDMTSPDADLREAFDTYFSLLLKSYESSNSADLSKPDRLLNANMKMQIEDLLHSLASEGVDALFSTEPIEDINDSEENSDLPESQKVVINRLLRATPILQKFSQIAREINVNRYVAEPTFGTSDILLEVLQVKLVSKFDFLTLIRTWPRNFAAITSQISDSWRCVLEFVLLSLSWKLEDLTYASSDNSSHSIDISLFLDDFNGLLISIGHLCVMAGSAAKELNETTSDTDVKMRSLIQNLSALEHSFACHYVDMLVSLRMFYDKFRDSESFKNFSVFFGSEAGVGVLAKGKIPESIENSLMRVFFVHESRLARVKGVSLDRLNQEDVNYDDYVFDVDIESDEPKEGETSDTQASDEPAHSNSRLESQTWAAEKALCVYTFKLFSLIHTDALSGAAVDRIQMNSKRLADTFQKVVDVGMAQCTTGAPAEPDVHSV